MLPSGSGGAGSNTAERWYELRGINTSGGTGTPTVYQQSTFSPDTSLYRWMGSIAQDNQGNMLMGYSGASSTVFPSIYITGRVPTDTLSTMESESQVYAGLNSQVNLSGYAYGYRWGDYTSMMMDPNDCTFWYTGEYLKLAGLFNWSTRILSFTFPGCTSLASITQPIPNSTVTSGSATFLWMPGTGSPSYTLSIGSTQGGNDYCGGTQSYAAGTYQCCVLLLADRWQHHLGPFDHSWRRERLPGLRIQSVDWNSHNHFGQFQRESLDVQPVGNLHRDGDVSRGYADWHGSIRS